MPQPDRKPLATMESKEPWTIRYAPCERAAITHAAIARGLEPSAFAREVSLIGLNVISTPDLMEAYLRTSAVLRASNGAEKR